MAKRINKAQLENIKRPYLIVHRAKAAEQIQCQIEKGRALLNIKINNEQDLENARSQYRKWSDYNAELLRRIVDTDDLVNDYYPGVISGFWGPTSLHERVQGF